MNEKSEMIGRIRYLITKDIKNKSQILRELNLSTSTLSDWEKGKGNPSCSAIMKLARYFNVTSDYLLFGTEKTQKKEFTPAEDKWQQVFYMLSDSERLDLLDIIQSSSDMEDVTVWLTYLSRLSKQERELCTAFINGILAEKNLKNN